jgi:glutamate/tyrosine decarboxylase-like PLP-dependent enzyme/serine/threonine protein kinase/Tfp pilus assembly protein PilF
MAYPALVRGRVLDGRFEIEELAGAGSMGSVYRARDTQTGARVAVKLVSRPDDLHRFEREVQILSTLDHPHVVRYVTHGALETGDRYLVLEWLEGEDLAAILNRGQPSLRDALELVAAIARTLADAHARGIVHRDIKPANVFLRESRFDRPKLLDFGIARLTGAGRAVTGTGIAVGTPSYMSPEQAQGAIDVGARADIFSLGCVLHECVTGDPPFLGTNLMAILAKVLFEEAPRLSEKARGVPEALDALALRMLSKDPAARPDAIEVARTLADIASMDPDVAKSTIRPSLRPVELGAGEQRLLSIVLIGPARSRPLSETDDTVVTEEARSPIALEKLIRSYGGQYSPLADGSSIAILAGEDWAQDLAHKAARCALALRRAYGDRAIALATGRAVAAGRVPVGEVIERAAAAVRRGRESSLPGIAIDEATRGLLDERFAIAAEGEALYLETEHRDHWETRRLLGKPMPCVGRTVELSMLASLYERTVAERSACAVLVTGSAGAGKSRVRQEFVRRIQEEHEPARVWAGRADPLAVGAPFGMIGSALARVFELEGDEPIADRVARIEARVGRTVAAEDVDRVASFLGEIAGVGFPDEDRVQLRAARADPTLMGDQIRRAFEDFVLAEARTGPLVLVLEDLQWGDGPSMRLCDAALRHARDEAFFVLAVGRPEAAGRFEAVAPGRGYHQVTLGNLSRAASEELVTAALGADLGADIRDEIVSRSSGNAFFLEELVRCVANGERTALPPTLLAVLTSRLEALEPEARRVLRAASVFGCSFAPAVVAELLGEHGARTVSEWLPVLVGAELVERKPDGPRSEYAFRHALVREAAYTMLTDQDRVVGHRLAARVLMRARDRDPLVLAEHLERGGEAAAAAEWLAKAAEQALEGHDFDAVLALAARGQAAIRGQGPSMLEGELALLEAEARRWRGELAAAEREAARAAELLLPGTRSWFRAVEEAMNAAGRRGDYAVALSWKERIEDTACDASAEVARQLALCSAGRQLFHAGRYELAGALVERLRKTETDDPRLEAEVQRLLGAHARHLGDIAGDLTHYERSLAAYERAGDARNECNARVSVGFTYLELGETAHARADLVEALAEAERMGLHTVATRARQNLSLVYSREGELETARELATRVIEESRAQGNVRFEGWTWVYLGRFLHALGRLDEAADACERAIALLEVTPPARAGAEAALALVDVDRGRIGQAKERAESAMVVLDRYGGIEEFEPLVWEAAARVALERGDGGRAAELLARAVERIERRAEAIADPELRCGFLERAPDNARLRALAASAVPEDGGTMPLPRPIEPSHRLKAAYEPAALSKDLEVVSRAVLDYLSRASRAEIPVVESAASPAEMLARFAPGFPDEPRGDLEPLIARLVSSSHHQHHPHYLGYQVSAPLPRAIALELLASALNSGMAAFDSGPASTALERRVIDWMLGVAGYGERGGGVLTSGGSLGNLTALLAARQAKASFDARERGLAGERPLAIFCSEEVHYSIERAAQVMGVGRANVIRLPVDARYRIVPDAIGPAVRAARDRGLRPFALVASAASTGTGAIDPLPAIADRCEEHDLWLHVDGAHGASALLSETHRGALAGIERASSLVWDAHKLMGMPALATAVLFRDGRASYETFAQRASYLFEGDPVDRWFDVGLRTVECTKPLISVPLYLTLQTLGTRVLGDLVDHAYALARRLAELVRAAPDFELACPPDSNIVCFRHLRADLVGSELDEHQRRVRTALREAGTFYIVTTELGEKTWLRTSLMSPYTIDRDLVALLDAVRAA